MGLRLDQLGTKRLSWRDLWLIVEHSPRSSALARATLGPDVIWGLHEHLLAGIADELRWLHWAKTKDAGKAKNPAPARIPRPGVRSDAKKLRIGEAMTIEEFERRYAEKLAKNAA